MSKIDLKKINRNKNKTKKEVKFTSIKSPLYLERQISKFNKFMVSEIEKRFKNQVLKKMNKSTISKFHDGRFVNLEFLDKKNNQIGNYALIYDKFFNKVRTSINKQFNTKRINKFIQNIFAQANNYNQKRFYQNANNTMGVDLDKVLRTDGLNSFINAKSLQSSDMLEKLKDETLTAYKTNILRRMSAGDNLQNLFDEVKKQTNLRLQRGDLIARNELKSFNSELANKRAENNGITKAIWRTSKDERVRSCHTDRDGKEYDIKKGLYSSCDRKTIKPSEEINCRCTAEYVVDFEDIN